MEELNTSLEEVAREVAENLDRNIGEFDVSPPSPPAPLADTEDEPPEAPVADIAEQPAPQDPADMDTAADVDTVVHVEVKKEIEVITLSGSPSEVRKDEAT